MVAKLLHYDSLVRFEAVRYVAPVRSQLAERIPIGFSDDVPSRIRRHVCLLRCDVDVAVLDFCA
jgi:hypothetical protein